MLSNLKAYSLLPNANLRKPYLQTLSCTYRFVIFVFCLSKYVCFILYFLPFFLNHPKVNFRHHNPLSLNTSTCIS